MRGERSEGVRGEGERSEGVTVSCESEMWEQ